MAPKKQPSTLIVYELEQFLPGYKVNKDQINLLKYIYKYLVANKNKSTKKTQPSPVIIDHPPGGGRLISAICALLAAKKECGRQPYLLIGRDDTLQACMAKVLPQLKRALKNTDFAFTYGPGLGNEDIIVLHSEDYEPQSNDPLLVVIDPPHFGLCASPAIFGERPVIIGQGLVVKNGSQGYVGPVMNHYPDAMVNHYNIDLPNAIMWVYNHDTTPRYGRALEILRKVDKEDVTKRGFVFSDRQVATDNLNKDLSLWDAGTYEDYLNNLSRGVRYTNFAVGIWGDVFHTRLLELKQAIYMARPAFDEQLNVVLFDPRTLERGIKDRITGTLPRMLFVEILGNGQGRGK